MGSGPHGSFEAPIFASSSAFSLPLILECPGTHISSTLFVVAILFNVSQHSSVRAESNSTDDRLSVPPDCPNRQRRFRP